MSKQALTDAQRAERARYMRDYRAGKARQRQLDRQTTARNADTKGVTQTTILMAESVEATIAAMKWLQHSDTATMNLARMYAQQIDQLRAEGDYRIALSTQRALNQVLRDLGGTPAMRMQHELRSRQLDAPTTPPADDDPQIRPRAAANVTSIKRPAKRRVG